jgi:alpha-tubulin suppressor-like RCC1 family protein
MTGAVALLAGCAGQDGATPPEARTPRVTAVAVTPATARVEVGRTATLSAQVTAEGRAALAVAWTSSDPARAIVTPDAGGGATVTGVMPGEVTITARSVADGTKAGTAQVTVTPAAGLALSLASTAVALTAGGPAVASQLTLARLGPFAGAVALAAEDLPPGVTAALTPPTLAELATDAQVVLSAAPTTVPGAYAVTVRARGQGVGDATAPLTLRVDRAPAAQLLVVVGDGQTAAAGAPVAVAPAVRVLDALGQPVVGVSVVFEVVGGGGTLVGERPTTDSTGRAALAQWTLGARGGPNTVTASVSGLSPVTFRATAFPTRFAALTAGTGHTCGVTAAGDAFCWGGNRGGSLGDGGTTPRLLPALAASGRAFAALAAGEAHTCGLLAGAGLGAAAAAVCWGSNVSGQLGDGTTESRRTSSAVVGRAFVALTANAGHTCGLTAAGQAFCWGQNAVGELGDGTRTDRTVPTPVASGQTFVALAAGGGHTCGLAAGGQTFCWGQNGEGQLGDGSTVARLVPTPVAGGLTFTAITAGFAHTCGLTAAGQAFCWGADGAGQLGDSLRAAIQTTPAAVRGGHAFAALAAGWDHTCGLAAGGRAYCWGRNAAGAVGDGALESIRVVPSPVAGGHTFRALVAGGGHVCGLTPADEALCWGANSEGALGDGTTTSRRTPTAIGAGGAAGLRAGLTP